MSEVKAGNSEKAGRWRICVVFRVGLVIRVGMAQQTINNKYG